jgi:tetratricopeptide (TPR) repeat protein
MTHYHYAWYLALFDRLDEAIVEHKLARDYDPLRPLHTAWLGALYNYGQRYDEAIEVAEKALELNPDFSPAYLVMAQAYTGKGMHEEAIAAAQHFVTLTPPDFGNAYLALTYADAGQRDEASRVAATLDQNNKTSTFLYVAAMAYTSLEDHDAAMRLLEVSYETRNPFLPWVRVANGRLDGLFDDPRFLDLLRRMNLSL